MASSNNNKDGASGDSKNENSTRGLSPPRRFGGNIIKNKLQNFPRAVTPRSNYRKKNKTDNRPKQDEKKSLPTPMAPTSTNFPHRSIIRMLHSSSDPALLVDEAGLVLHSNNPARSFFHVLSSTCPKHESVLPHKSISSLMTFQQQEKKSSKSTKLSVVEAMTVRDADEVDNSMAWEEVIQQIAFDIDAEDDETGVDTEQEEIPVVAHCLDDKNFSAKSRVVDLEVTTTTGEKVYCVYVTHDDTDILPPPQSLASVEKGMFSHVGEVMQGVLDASFDPIFSIDENGIILTSNRAATKIFGYEEMELIGSNISMICGGGHASKHDQYLERYLRTGIKRVMGIKRELPARRKDGSEFSIELGLCEMFVTSSAEERRRVFYGFVRDITHQKEHQLELERKQKFCERIIEASIDGLFVICEKGNIHMVNDASTRVFGWTKDELLGENISKIMPEIHSSVKLSERCHDCNYTLMTNEENVVGKYQKMVALRRDGTEFPVTLGLTQVEGTAENRYMYVGFVHDISHEKKMIDMEIEKTAAELLLNNMLPEDIALRLKEDPSHIADSHEPATILFADIVGFTKMSSTMSPKKVVSMLNDLFSMFDDLVDKYGLNKVKTIGDCYMVTNVPMVTGDVSEECARICHFGLDMIDALHKFNESHPEHNLNLRVGINYGPVVAGVVGTTRFLYDLWGDAVNLASRMESTGVPGKIQVTEDIVTASKGEFVFESRGIVDVKGKGKMEAFLLTKRIGSSLRYSRKKQVNGIYMSGHSVGSVGRRMSLKQSLAILSFNSSIDMSKLHELDDQMDFQMDDLSELSIHEEVDEDKSDCSIGIDDLHKK